MDEHLAAAALDVAEIEDGRLSRTVYLSRSRLFPMSSAAEHIYGLLEELMHDAIKAGRWRANRLDKTASDAAALSASTSAARIDAETSSSIWNFHSFTTCAQASSSDEHRVEKE